MMLFKDMKVSKDGYTNTTDWVMKYSLEGGILDGELVCFH